MEREEEEFRKRTTEKIDKEEDQEESQEYDRNEHLDAGDDMIGMELNDAEKINYGASLDAMEGNLGDESEDTGDLPEGNRKIGNRYDPALSVGRRKNAEKGTNTTGFQ